MYLFFVCLFEQVCKPGSVVNGHLSWYTVTSIIMRFFCGTERAILYCSFHLASSGVYIAFTVTSKAVSFYLTFPPLPISNRRFISVALSLESPPPAVNWHSALWSPDFPHFCYKSATIQLTLIYYMLNTIFLSIIIFHYKMSIFLIIFLFCMQKKKFLLKLLLVDCRATLYGLLCL